MPPGEETAFDTQSFDTESDAVPTVGGADALTLVDGRTFVISQRSGDLGGQTHGVVVDDRRHLSRYRLQVEGAMLETLVSATPNPLSAVIVQRLVDPVSLRPSSCLVVRRRSIGGGMRERIEVRQTSSEAAVLDVDLTLGADFAHVFDVKSGRGRSLGAIDVDGDDVWWLRPADGDDAEVATRVRWAPATSCSDPGPGSCTGGSRSAHTKP